VGKLCKKCGSALTDDAKYCGQCGEKVGEETERATCRCPKCNSANVTATPKEYKPKLTAPLVMTFGGFGLMFLGVIGLAVGALLGLVIGAIVNGLVPQTYQTVITCSDCGYSGVCKDVKK
jgi:hypothetical protein